MDLSYIDDQMRLQLRLIRQLVEHNCSTCQEACHHDCPVYEAREHVAQQDARPKQPVFNAIRAMAERDKTKD